jgi:hypothetical protein
MPSAPYDLSISAARAGALSASPLQRSDEPSARQVRRAIATAIGVRVRGCPARVAQAYGEHPETALSCAGPGRRWTRAWTIRYGLRGARLGRQGGEP